MIGTRSWLIQNRFACFLILFEIAAVLFVVCVALPFLTDSVVFWQNASNAEAETSQSGLEQQIAVLTRDNQQLQQRLDSLQIWREQALTPEGCLSFIRSDAANAGLVLSSYDIESTVEDNGNQLQRFSLSLTGKYHSYGSFIANLESSPFAVEIESVSLQSSQFGSSTIVGQVVVSVQLVGRP